MCNVDVWLIHLETHGPHHAATTCAVSLASSETFLSQDEELRAARFRFPDDRDRWIRARSSLRAILSTYAERPPGALQFTLGPHGKPSLSGETGIEFSLSHSGAWAMVAVTRGIPVGIDIERIRERVDMAALLRRIGEPNPRPDADQAILFQTWTRREAMTKALGGALLEAPAGDLRTCALEAPDSYAASLALLGYHPDIRRCQYPVPASGAG